VIGQFSDGEHIAADQPAPGIEGRIEKAGAIGISASIGDIQPHVQPHGGTGHLLTGTGLVQIDTGGAGGYAVILFQFLRQCLQGLQAAGDQHQVESHGRQLAGIGCPCTIGGAGNHRPGTVFFPVCHRVDWITHFLLRYLLR